MRDIQTIDGELRLLVAIRRMVRGADGLSSSTAQIDGLLDERTAVAAARWQPALASAEQLAMR